MIPLYDENPTDTFPFVTISLIVLNFLVYGYELVLLASGKLNAFINHYSLTPALVVSPPFALSKYVPVVSSLFIHASFLHIGGNMLFLWIFGNNIEDILGHVRFFFFYFLCGFVAAGIHIIFNLNSHIPTLGASGAIAGVLGAYILLFPRARIVTLIPLFFLFPLVPLPAVVVLGMWIVLQFFSGIFSIASGFSGGVAWFAHIGGFLTGMLLIKLLPKRKPGKTLIS